MRRKGDPRDPAHITKNTAHSGTCRNASARERGMNSTEEPPNRRGRSIRRAAERKSKASKKKAAEVDA